MNVQTILGAKGTAVYTITADASLADAVVTLRDRGVGSLVVSNDGRSIDGIISERDVVRAMAAHGGAALGRQVSSAMSTDVITCTTDDSVDSLMASMTTRRIRHLPVADGEGKLGGLVSIGDVVKARLGQLESENEHLVNYIQGG